MTTPFTFDTDHICDDPKHTMFECQECNLQLDTDCRCMDDYATEGGQVYCVECKKEFYCNYDKLAGNAAADREQQDYDDEYYADQADWLDRVLGGDNDAEPDTLADIEWWTGTGKGTGKKDSTEYTIEHYTKCRHYDQKVTLPGGTEVFASSNFTRKGSAATPDLGVYLDSIWSPTSPAYFIDWMDYGQPRDSVSAVKVLMDAWHKAKDGYWVEFGCIGGHGRTGTALACMAILDSDGKLTAQEAVDWVQKEYCKEAVESDEQIWWASYFRAVIFGGTADDEVLKSYNKVSKKTETKTVIHDYEYPGIGTDYSFWNAKTPKPEDGGVKVEKFERKVPVKKAEVTSTKPKTIAEQFKAISQGTLELVKDTVGAVTGNVENEPF